MTAERWTSYAEMGQSLRVENNDFGTAVEDLGFNVELNSTGSLQIEDGFDNFQVYRHHVDDPSGEATWVMGYEVVHKENREEGEIPVTNVITFKTEDGALNYIADPETWETEHKASRGW